MVYHNYESILNSLLQYPHIDISSCIRYLKRYAKFIESRIRLNEARSLVSNYNIHHIIPRSWGGTDDTINLVKLTRKEHLIAHHLLYYTKDVAMVSAFRFMFDLSKGDKDFRYNLTVNQQSLLYEEQSKIRKSRRVSKESRKKIAERLKEYFKNNPNPNAQKVINCTTLEIYDSITKAEIDNGYRKGKIYDAIHRRLPLDGVRWEILSVYRENNNTPSQKNNSKEGGRFSGKSHTEKSKQRIKDSSKKRQVINLKDNRIYESTSEASRLIGKNRATVSRGLREAKLKGLNVYNDSLGNRWMFLDECDIISITNTN